MTIKNMKVASPLDATARLLIRDPQTGSFMWTEMPRMLREQQYSPDDFLRDLLYKANTQAGFRAVGIAKRILGAAVERFGPGSNLPKT